MTNGYVFYAQHVPRVCFVPMMCGLSDGNYIHAASLRLVPVKSCGEEQMPRIEQVVVLWRGLATTRHGHFAAL